MPPPTFWPADLWARTEVDRWAEGSKINIAPGFTATVFWRVVRTAPAQRDPAAITTALRALEGKLAIADARLSQHAHLVGDDFTLADIQFGHILYRYFDIDIDRAGMPQLFAYYQRLVARPAFETHVMLSYEGLRIT